MTETDIIEKFLASYHREFDFYQEAARLCAQRCEHLLETRGIRAIVTYRAKKPKSLQAKLKKRNEKKEYQTTEEIYEDLVDLAGVRIALYFPGKINEVDQLIREDFNIQDIKLFPEQPKGKVTIPSDASLAGIRLGLYFPENITAGIESIQHIAIRPTDKEETAKRMENVYKKIFSGYSARHYRVYMKFNEELERFNAARIEIQVASVLIHAWAEVEHDIIYKPQNDQLSEEEHAILDELNGLVLAGEIALNRLEKAAQETSNKGNQPFRDHYVLASYIYDTLKKGNQEPNMGKIDSLFRFLQDINKNTPREVNKYLSDLEINTISITVAEQIIDKIIEGDENLYNDYEKSLLKSNTAIESKYRNKIKKEYNINGFIKNWTIIEKAIRNISPAIYNNKTIRYIINNITSINDELKNDIIHTLEQRDMIVHKNSIKLYQKLGHYMFEDYIHYMPKIIEKLLEITPDDKKSTITSLLDIK